MLIAVPTFALVKVNVGVPLNVTSSPETTPLNAAVPVAVALVLPSYTLLTPVNPVTVNGIEVSASITSLEISVVLNDDELV